MFYEVVRAWNVIVQRSSVHLLRWMKNGGCASVRDSRSLIKRSRLACYYGIYEGRGREGSGGVKYKFAVVECICKGFVKCSFKNYYANQKVFEVLCFRYVYEVFAKFLICDLLLHFKPCL